MVILRRKLRRDLARHRAQFVAIVVTIFLGVMLFAASYDSFRNLEASYAETATLFRFANITTSGGDTTSIESSGGALPGVEAATTRSVADIPMRIGDSKLLGRAVGMPAASDPAVNRLLAVEGDAHPGSGVVVEKHMADHFGLAPGSTIDLLDSSGTWQSFDVVGVGSSPEYIWPARSRNEVITTPDDFGVVFAANSTVESLTNSGANEALFYFDGGLPSPGLESQLTDVANRFGAVEVYSRADQPSNAALEEDLAGFAELSLFFPILFLTAAALAAYMMITRLVHAQRPLIGVLRASGFSRGRILRHYLGYGLAPGVIGAVPGAIAGVLLARLITHLYVRLLAVPVTIVEFYPTTLVAALLLGVAASVASALAPALVASRVAPAEAMRGETPAGATRFSVLERALPLVRRLPVRWRMAVRGIERNPRRTAYTMVGVILSLMLVLVSWGMIDTVVYLMNRQFVEIERQDAQVYFTTPVDASSIAALQDVAGIARAEPVLQAPVVVTGPAGRYDTALVALPADTAMHRFFSSGEPTTLPDMGILLGSAGVDRIGAHPGQSVEVAIGGAPPIAVPLAAAIDEPLGTLAYTTLSEVGRVAGAIPPISSALVSYDPGADRAAIRADLVARPDIAAFEDAQALYDSYRRLLALFYGFVGVMLAFGAAMAFALIFNAMSVNIAERTREVGTLLAVGTDRHTLNRLITTENLLVALLGIGPGLIAGYWISKVAMASFASDMFTFDLHVAIRTYLVSAGAIVAVALLAQWPGLRAIRRLDIAKIVKERSA